MAKVPLTHFTPDPERLEVIRECMESYNVGDLKAEWPNNIISRQAVVYGSGVIARRSESIHHSVDPDELTLCRQLSAEAEKVMDETDVGMGSSSSDPFRGFFIAANVGESVSKITEELVRAKFGNTLFPPVTITVEPLAESGVWWSEVEEDGSESDPEYFLPWREMIQWFRNRPEFVDTRFVRIGHDRDLWELPRKDYPEGTEITGCVLPRLALGLTRGGSLVGLFGYSVKS
ncbi:hypothetical protein KIH39_17905 [Telmatocola sphagniphila]|uniref:Uncharacterized protein n=1 Tax=Telmatocola sphagniphila TaxID=1123043 RepID=A0A8E6B2N4_9BACT|nr:hypothetical protein [Telmatocola sphagniphila]QVL30717.1 hypothetical protein KIH39_17905 [Telmatocola sphagniphila]